MADVDDIRAKTVDEIREHLIILKKEQFNLRFQKASGELENTARIRQVRREIARTKSIMGEYNGKDVVGAVVNAKADTTRNSG